ncbi:MULTISPECIES: UDP-N-acetylmuramate dehydrogenase [Bacillus]|uniref:UDP-N-acetylenolpyruvoylglucosamine reductase 1 n=1 Tax=Bacillus thuringiensis subsp. konkukian (strain 97-27) TaxID=281309 RepID=MURB1_BACHK|nr:MULTISPECIES: UDP-N-acetylmuramate dehydrogenase [Bacillus]Q6HEQ5.1 RecName: Full=UDP-N-acetylenolpyruvoylglucosamine reductase 1; AltName: Full=UDP-N-acetylmuramate dehydrogenase 1 [[Bacillus thuringiensis] serovar konkukian str. 97-27]AAT61607.1 UDP-N-acetylenolpyruvoylglucosamine reductase (UDP-N-acetylmuramate dehydrogenase) [[Bacillus thuringiensis] serovar konkukian str. 97-27]AJI34325.1 UDP-N-acetylenolpyruvoylglucosamine reductase [Bacillus thuringiensis]MBL3848743.1 UDP-N-acetylmura
MEQLVNELIEANVGRVLVDEPLARYTTMKIGGPADILIVPKHVAGIEKTLQLVKKYKTKWTVIGRGSNLLVSDLGIEGVVIRLGEGLDHLEVEKHRVRVGGGYPLIKLSTLLSRQGLAGLEFASGIPGSVGGAVYMNAGAHKSDISNILSKALILFEDGTIDWLTHGEMGFSYRTSVLQTKRPGIVLEAEFQLQIGERERIVSVMQKNKDYRRETQPWNHPCAGSVFRNPTPYFAGDLIEKAGLRGYQIGGAQISEMHGNFIINTGGASAQDVLSLIALIKQTIKDKFGVEMHTEVEIIGR